MKTRLFWAVLAWLTVLIPTVGFAEHEVGTGGAIVRCSGDIPWMASANSHRAELLDFALGYETHHLEIVRRNDSSVEDQVAVVAASLSFDPSLQRRFLAALSTIRSSARYTTNLFENHGIRPAPVPSLADTFSEKVVNGRYRTEMQRGTCTFQMAALGSILGPVFFDTNAVDSLSTTDQAGLWVHETFYLLIRTRLAFVFGRPSVSSPWDARWDSLFEYLKLVRSATYDVFEPSLLNQKETQEFLSASF